MSVYAEKRKGALTGVWFGEITHNGHRFRERFDTKAAAEAYCAHIKAFGKPPKDATCGPKDSFRQVALDCKRDHAPWKSGRDKSVILRLEWVIEQIGDVPISDVTSATLRGLVVELQKPNKRGIIRSPATINRYLTAVSTVFSYAQDEERLDKAPKIPWQRETGGRLHWLTHEQEAAVCALLEAAGWPNEAFLVNVLTATGMRLGELMSLEPSQIEDDWIRLWETKTDNPRSVPIAPDMARRLRALVASNALPHPRVMLKHFKEACRSAGYSPKLVLHSLRHTTATRVLKETNNLAITQRYLGHKNIKTTLRYAHTSDVQLQEASKLIAPNAGQKDNSTAETSEVVPMRALK